MKITASVLKNGCSKMTRFGMEDKDFEELAQLIFEVIKKTKKC